MFAIIFLGARIMEFLGHQVRGDVITQSRDNLEKVRNTPRLTTNKQVRSFMGLVHCYMDHIPAFAEIYFSTINRPPEERKGQT